MNRPIIITQGPNSLKLLYSVMNLNTISLPTRATNMQQNAHVFGADYKRLLLSFDTRITTKVCVQYWFFQKPTTQNKTKQKNFPHTTALHTPPDIQTPESTLMMTEDDRERRYWQWWVMRPDLPQNHVCALVVLLTSLSWSVCVCVCVCVCEREREREREPWQALYLIIIILTAAHKPQTIINSHQVESFFFQPLGTFFV
jgi:hypothetical protein